MVGVRGGGGRRSEGGTWRVCIIFSGVAVWPDLGLFAVSSCSGIPASCKIKWKTAHEHSKSAMAGPLCTVCVLRVSHRSKRALQQGCRGAGGSPTKVTFCIFFPDLRPQHCEGTHLWQHVFCSSLLPLFSLSFFLSYWQLCEVMLLKSYGAPLFPPSSTSSCTCSTFPRQQGTLLLDM